MAGPLSALLPVFATLCPNQVGSQSGTVGGGREHTRWDSESPQADSDRKHNYFYDVIAVPGRRRLGELFIAANTRLHPGNCFTAGSTALHEGAGTPRDMAG